MRVSDGREDCQAKAKDGADLIEFLAYSGARIREVTGGGYAKVKRALLWSDVDLEKGTAFLPGTKTEAAPRTIPMSDRLRELLLCLKAEKNHSSAIRFFPFKARANAWRPPAKNWKCQYSVSAGLKMG
jgi:integrase